MWCDCLVGSSSVVVGDPSVCWRNRLDKRLGRGHGEGEGVPVGSAFVGCGEILCRKLDAHPAAILLVGSSSALASLFRRVCGWFAERRL